MCSYDFPPSSNIVLFGTIFSDCVQTTKNFNQKLNSLNIAKYNTGQQCKTVLWNVLQG